MNDETPKRKGRWVPIVLGVLLMFTILGVGCVVLTVSWFRQNLSVAETTSEAAERQMNAVRERFPGQQPLIQLIDGKPQYVADRTAQTAPSTQLTSLHVMAFDDDEGNLVTFSLPFWLLRLKSGPIRISAYQQGWDDRGVSFRIEDLEKHGPGIIVDVTEPNQGRVVMWAE